MRNLIIIVASASLWPLLTPVAYAAAPQTAHYVELPESVPIAMLRFSGWLVDDGVPYATRIVEAPQFGVLSTKGDEVYVPDSEFAQAGLDHFVVELTYLDELGQDVVEEHWISIRRAELMEPIRWREDFEPSSTKEPIWDQFGDSTIVEFSRDSPIEGEISCQILLQPESTAYLRFYPESMPGTDNAAHFGVDLDLPEPEPADPVGLDVVALSDGGARKGARIELRVVEDHWQARASTDPLAEEGPRLATDWVTVPHVRDIRLEIEHAPELIGKPGAGDFLGFYVSVGAMRFHEDWLFGTRSAGSKLDIGVLDVGGSQSGAVRFDGVRGRSAAIFTRTATQESFETGQWGAVWTEQPGPMVVASGSSISGTKDLAIELDPVTQDSAWLVDPTPEKAQAVTSSFVLDVEALGLGAREGLRLWSLHDDEADGSPWLAQVEAWHQVDGPTIVRLLVTDDSGVRHSSGWRSVFGKHRITADWSASDGGGGAVLWIDSTSYPVGGTLFNASRLAEAVRIGAWDVVLRRQRQEPATVRLDNVLNVH